MRRFGTAVAVLLAIVLIPSAACAEVPPTGGAPTSDYTGVSPGAPVLWGDDAELRADMAAIAESGATWVRLDIDWSAIEPSEGSYDWQGTERAVGAAREHGLRVLGLLTYTPEWARPEGLGSHAPPIDDAAFARFAAAAAARLGDDVDAWEVWNEPNLPDFWEPEPDPARYANLLAATSTAVREVDAEAVVVTGGLAPAESDGERIAPEDFLAEVYEAGVADTFDAVGAHPYSYPALPSDALTARWNSFYRLPLLHAVMVDNGHADKAVWLTEFGAPTGTDDGAVSPERQAEILADGFELARRWPWVGPLFVYSLRDSGSDPDDREQNFGVLTADREPKPAWDTLRAETARPWGRE